MFELRRYSELRAFKVKNHVDTQINGRFIVSLVTVLLEWDRSQKTDEETRCTDIA